MRGLRCPNPRCRRELDSDYASCPDCGQSLDQLRRLAALCAHHYDRAIDAAAAGDEEQALEHLVAAAALDPNDPDIHCFIGRLHARAGRMSAAERHWQRALELAPSHPRAKEYLKRTRRAVAWTRIVRLAGAAVVAVAAIWSVIALWPDPPSPPPVPPPLAAVAPAPGPPLEEVTEAIAAFADPMGISLAVRLSDGRITIEGIVPSELHAAAVAAVAEAAASGWPVDDRIVCDPPVDLEPVVTAALLREPGLSGYRFAVECRGAHVILSGRAVTSAEVSLAVAAVGGVPGVETVDVRGLTALLTEPDSYRHELRPGETLWSLAELVYGDGWRWPEIAAASGIADPRDIREGEIVVIPSRSRRTAEEAAECAE